MKQTIFLTGATGTMGQAGMHELLRYPDRYNVRVLARPSHKNKNLLEPLMAEHPSLTVVWGDLTRYDDVLSGVTGSDVVLHVGGMVSPAADYRPRATYKTNITAACNVRDAVLAQPADRQPKVVYIGSVAQMGDRREPLHWGRAGDPICVSAYDHYGLTKILAERIITGSGIKQWVSLRQSGILYPAILKNYDPIMFHVPLRGVLEWATVEDSGRLLEGVCRPEVSATFWNNYYNIGSGEQYRLSNYEFECLLLEAIGCPKPEQIFDTKWFATRNFHGMWYLDSDRLNELVPFRADVPIREYFAKMAESPSVPKGIRIARITKAAKLVPHIVKLAMRHLAYSEEHGTQWWIRHHVEQRIHAYYGSLEAYKAIPDWQHIDRSHPSREAIILDHGYDESKPMDQLTIADLKKAAAFRGGKLLTGEADLTAKRSNSEAVKQPSGLALWDTPLQWQSASGEVFEATPRLILLGGHWAPGDLPFPYRNIPDTPERPWHWDEVAKHNPFFAQIWTPLHEANEDNVYGSDIFTNWEK